MLSFLQDEGSETKKVGARGGRGKKRLGRSLNELDAAKVVSRVCCHNLSRANRWGAEQQLVFRFPFCFQRKLVRRAKRLARACP